MVSTFTCYVMLCCLGFLCFYGRGDFFNIEKKERSGHEEGNHRPSSCFCRIMAACCSFVRWNSVPDCYEHGYEIREPFKGGKMGGNGWAFIGRTDSIFLFLYN